MSQLCLSLRHVDQHCVGTKGLQIDIEHWVSHWNIEKIDIDIDIEYLFNVFIFHIDIEFNSIFEIQYIEKLLNVFNVSILLNFSQYFSMFLNVSQYFSIFLNISQYFSIFLNFSQFFSIFLNIFNVFNILSLILIFLAM